MPFERIQTILLASQYHGRFKNTTHVFKSLRAFGFKEYYRGYSAIILRNGLSNFIFFYLRVPFRERLLSLRSPDDDERRSATSRLLVTDFVVDFVSGATIGAMCSATLFPMNVLKNRMQMRIGGRHLSLRDAFSVILAERRTLRGFYYGVSINSMRSFLSWGIINATYELLRALLIQPDAAIAPADRDPPDFPGE